MSRYPQTGIHSSWLSVILAPMLALAAGAPQVALAQKPQMPAPAKASDESVERARLLGMLTYTQVTMAVDNMPARDAFDAFRLTTGIPIVARWSDDAVGFGLEPRTLITIDATDKPALDLLEEMLEQCAVYEECTWQLRKGFVEAGTKQRLAVPAARETRVYDVRHLMLEAPMFAPPNSGSDDESERKYDAAFTGRRMKMVELRNGEWVFRKNPDELASEVVTAVVEVIEPGMWDVGQDRDTGKRGDELTEPASSAAVPGAAPAAANSPAPQPRARAGTGKWATLRVWRDQMIIKAPDFMHRQVNGYPKPIKPEGDLHRLFDPNARGRTSDPEIGVQESTQDARPVTPAPNGDSGLPEDTSKPQRPPNEPIDPPKSPGDYKKPKRPH
jgi:hypothetical protein